MSDKDLTGKGNYGERAIRNDREEVEEPRKEKVRAGQQEV